jgi:hypothetical protein
MSTWPQRSTRTLTIRERRRSKDRPIRALLPERTMHGGVRADLDGRSVSDVFGAQCERPESPIVDGVRTGDPCCRDAGRTVRPLDAGPLDATMLDFDLLQRPIGFRGAHAPIGRPPEQTLELL